MRLGIIGTRGQAALWARAASRTAGWEVSACYHPRRSRRDPASPCRQTDDLEELLSRSDAVLIASPTRTHPEYLRLLSRRFHGPVLVEKPAASTVAECLSLGGSLSRPFLTNRLRVAHNWRFYPWVRRLRDLLRRGGEGVISAEFHLTHDFAYKPGYRRSWRSREASHPAGPMETQGIHWIDLAHLLFGPVQSVFGRAVNLAGTGTAPDTCSAVLRMRSGLVCSIHASYAAPFAHYARVATPSMILTYRNGALTSQARPLPPPRGKSRPGPSHLLFRGSLERLFSDSLRLQLQALHPGPRGSRRGELATWPQAAANTAVLGAFTRSIRTGAPVAMESIRPYRTWVRGFTL